MLRRLWLRVLLAAAIFAVLLAVSWGLGLLDTR